MKKVKILGLTCGVGSMMIPAKELNWTIMGNIEHRPYYHTGTFENYFNSPMVKKLSEINIQEAPDVIIGHTDCGFFSNLRSRKTKGENDFKDTELWFDNVKKLSPQFFILDNLPGMLNYFNADFFAEKFPEYNITFEWVSNYHYGNIQLKRNRLFIIGHKHQGDIEPPFIFVPREEENTITLGEVISDLQNREDYTINNVFYKDDSPIHPWTHQMMYNNGDSSTKAKLAEFKKYATETEIGKNLSYYNKKGEIKKKIGTLRIRYDAPSKVLTGNSGQSTILREDGTPLNIRERARIQGAPDDFIFLPLNPNKAEYSKLILQTGKFIPVQFCRYLIKQINYYIQNGRNYDLHHARRMIKSNPIINDTQSKYCQIKKLPSEFCRVCSASNLNCIF